jgi:hypothetical protein
MDRTGRDGRRTDRDFSDARDPGRDGGHEKRREERMPSGGDIDADPLDGNDPLAAQDAGPDFGLEVAELGELSLGEGSDVVRGHVESRSQWSGQDIGGTFDLFAPDPDALEGDTVELRTVAEEGPVPLPADRFENGPDGRLVVRSEAHIE